MADRQEPPRGTDRRTEGASVDDEEAELPSLRDEIRTAAQYGVAGKWAAKRRAKIRAELDRNRRGDYKIPTWVLAAFLVAFVTAWVLVIVLA